MILHFFGAEVIRNLNHYRGNAGRIVCCKIPADWKGHLAKVCEVISR
jgi:hypothetical protein